MRIYNNLAIAITRKYLQQAHLNRALRWTDIEITKEHVRVRRYISDTTYEELYTFSSSPYIRHVKWCNGVRTEKQSGYAIVYTDDLMTYGIHHGDYWCVSHRDDGQPYILDYSRMTAVSSPFLASPPKNTRTAILWGE
jgi:hypothetical protein